MNFKSKINLRFLSEPAGIFLVSVVSGCFFGLISMIAAAVYGDLTYQNPFWIMCCFYLFYTVCHAVLFNPAKNSYSSEIVNGFVFGSLKISTGVILALFAFSFQNSNVEAFIWTFIALWLVESGIKNIGHSSFVARANYRKKLAELVALNERIRIEDEMAARWAEQEAERKRKVAMEEELMADLESFLENP
jgi:hypothetical protein